MSFLIVFMLFCNLTYIICDNGGRTVKNLHISRTLKKIPPQNYPPVNSQQAPAEKNSAEKSAVVDVKLPEAPKETVQSVKNITSTNKTTSKNDTLSEDINKKIKGPTMESGALVRGILVIVALSILFMIYMAFRPCCSGVKPSMVNKYGVRTRRGDLEMTPLPLDDDDDDDTLFDAGNLHR